MIVLIADDNRLLLSTFGMLLRMQGHEVMEADSGARALELAAQRRPDAAVIDLHMPVVTGLQVGRRLCSMEVPFIFVSAYDESDVRDAAFACGASEYLLKPATSEALGAAVARCLDTTLRATRPLRSRQP
jgi:response regulator NasT